MKNCPKCSAELEDKARFCASCGALVDSGGDDGDPWLGKLIVNKFRIEKLLGSGAMGTIYKAVQVTLDKAVVIKLLHRHLLGDPTLSKRFHREAKAASLLNHPNCIGIIDFGQTDDKDKVLYIAMEYIDGVDLSELIHRDFPLDNHRVIHILKQVCQGLDEAHANGVLHRDLKPENIMVEQRRNQPDFVKVLDFGIAKLQEHSPGGPGTFQTVAGVVCGTPEYMSPEQARGEKLDGRSDLYSIGILMYQMLTNTLPFEAESALGVVTKHLAQPPPPMRQRRPDLHPSLEALTMTLLEKDRKKRPSSTLDVVAELDRVERELIIASAQSAKPESDKTVVELRPVQLLELEQAQQAAAAQQAAQPTANQPFADTIPGGSPELEAAVGQAVATQAQAAPQTQVVARTPAPAAAKPSSARFVLIILLVAAIVALGGFLVYRFAIAGNDTPDELHERLYEAPELVDYELS